VRFFNGRINLPQIFSVQRVKIDFNLGNVGYLIPKELKSVFFLLLSRSVVAFFTIKKGSI